MTSNLNSNVFVTKFELTDKILYAKVTWKENETDLFHIQICDGETCWSGTFSNDGAEEYRGDIQETRMEYLKNVREALTAASDRYLYKLNTDDEPNFGWQKVLPQDEEVQIDYGSVQLKEERLLKQKDELIDLLLTENKQLNKIIEMLNEKSEVANAELATSKRKLEEFADMKNSMETTLYGKFVNILNTKKRRIQLLEENLTSIPNIST